MQTHFLFLFSESSISISSSYFSSIFLYLYPSHSFFLSFFFLSFFFVLSTTFLLTFISMNFCVDGKDASRITVNFTNSRKYKQTVRKSANIIFNFPSMSRLKSFICSILFSLLLFYFFFILFLNDQSTSLFLFYSIILKKNECGLFVA